MSGYKHILFAADLIAADDNPVIERVIELQKSNGSQLSIVHAVEFPPIYATSYEIPTVASWEQELEAAAKERMEKISAQLQIPKKNQYLQIGLPKQQILDVAEKISADLIVVGSHARHGLGLFFLGSTANAILHHAKCDVLAVRV